MQQFYIYTDASFSNKYFIGVAGFIIYTSTEQHENMANAAPMIRTFAFNEKNNVRMEIKGIVLALKTLQEELMPKECEIILYTDCRSIINLITRRSLPANKASANLDIYKDFFELYDKLHPQIIWIKGHSPESEHDLIRNNFSIIDKRVRKELRHSVLNLK